jgi:outer membrane protein TolC
VALALGAPAAAQTPVPAISFDAAVARALDRNPTVAQAATSIARAEAILQQNRALVRPQVLAQVNSSTLDTDIAFDENVVVPQTQVTFTAAISQYVLAPARWAATVQARDQVEVATRSQTEVRQQVGVATAQAYLRIIAARRQVLVEEQALDTARAHLDYAQRRLEAGAGSRLNMLRGAQDVTEVETRLETVRFAVRQAQEALGVLLAEDGPIDAESEPTFVIPPDATSETVWMTTRPDIQTQTSIIRANDRIVRDSWKDVAPEVTASFDPQYITPSGLFQPSKSWRLTFSLTQPVFQGGLQRAVTAERESTLTSSRIALTDLQIQARSEVRLAREAISSRERTLASARQAVEQAEEVRVITTTAFEAGATTNLEVIDAQRSARDAEVRAALAEDALQQARLDLLVAIGQFPR